MASVFHDRPDAVANTLAIAERCARFDLTKDLGYTFPHFRGQDRQTALRALLELCRSKLDKHYPPGSEHRADALGEWKKN